MDVLVTYDVGTTSEDGEARLRRVATVCRSYGQRVQKSVFECRLGLAKLEELEARLSRLINPKVDSLRFYQLHGGRDKCLRAYGVDCYVDYDGPLLV